MGAEPEDNLVAEVARLRISLDRAATSTQASLAAHPPAYADGDPRSPVAQHRELCRQLAALRERAAVAESGNEGPRALRAELATLLSFARTLQDDADNWRSTLEVRIKEVERQQAAERLELERQQAAARRERERLAAEREKLVRRRDALRSTIVQTAGRMAQQSRGECRNTLPVFTLREGLTICSVSVSSPRRGLRFAKQWLVTLDGSHDLLVRRE